MKRATLKITVDGQESFDGVSALVDCRIEWDGEVKKWKASAENDAWTVHDDNSNRAAIRCLANRLGVGDQANPEDARLAMMAATIAAGIEANPENDARDWGEPEKVAGRSIAIARAILEALR